MLVVYQVSFSWFFLLLKMISSSKGETIPSLQIPMWNCLSCSEANESKRRRPLLKSVLLIHITMSRSPSKFRSSIFRWAYQLNHASLKGFKHLPHCWLDFFVTESDAYSDGGWLWSNRHFRGDRSSSAWLQCTRCRPSSLVRYASQSSPTDSTVAHTARDAREGLTFLSRLLSSKPIICPARSLYVSPILLDQSCEQNNAHALPGANTNIVSSWCPQSFVNAYLSPIRPFLLYQIDRLLLILSLECAASLTSSSLSTGWQFILFSHPFHRSLFVHLIHLFSFHLLT